MTKAVLYARVSSKEQEREGFSIAAQLDLLREYAVKNGFKIVHEFVEAETAKKSGRKQFNAMLDYLKKNEVRDLLVEKSDRLTRNFNDFVLLDPDTTGFRLHLVKEGTVLDKESRSHDKFIWSVKTSVAKLSNDNLSEEVKEGMSQKVVEKMWPSAAPIGYVNKLDDHTIIPDPKSAPHVRRAFELAATGQYSLRQIQDTLYNQGFRSKKGNAVSKSTIDQILKRPLYYGAFLWKGQLCQGSHEPIISKSLFDQFQAVLGRATRPKAVKHSFPYSGLMTCGNCGCLITPERQRKKSGLTFIYYHCTNGKRNCDKVKYLRQETIDVAFANAPQQIQLPHEIVEWTRQRLIEDSHEERAFRETTIQGLTERYKKLDRYIGDSYEDKLEGSIEPSS